MNAFSRACDLLASRNDWTQKDVAAELKVTAGFISQMRTGHRAVPPRLCEKIALLTKYEITAHDLRPDVFRPMAASDAA